jgi:hypothetical protein
MIHWSFLAARLWVSWLQAQFGDTRLAQAGKDRPGSAAGRSFYGTKLEHYCDRCYMWITGAPKEFAGKAGARAGV